MAIPDEIVMGRPISLAGVAEAWESDQDVRARVRTNRRLFVSETPDDFEPTCKCATAALNSATLAPLADCVGKFRNNDGSTQLFGIAQVEKESFGSI